VKGREGRIRKQLLDVLKEKRGYWKLKEIALLENSLCKRIWTFLRKDYIIIKCKDPRLCM
jgi:hypothetical protein